MKDATPALQYHLSAIGSVVTVMRCAAAVKTTANVQTVMKQVNSYTKAYGTLKQCILFHSCLCIP